MAEDGPGIWYGTSSEAAAWAERSRHTGAGARSASARMAHCQAELDNLLDLTDAATLKALGVRSEDLVTDDLTLTQAVGAWAERAGYKGLIVPSAALPGATVLAVFRPHLAAVQVVQVEDHFATPDPSKQAPA